MANKERVLIIGPSWLGDMIMSQSLFKLLHEKGKEIDVLAPAWCKDILACMPEVKNVIELPFEHGDLKLFERFIFAKRFKTLYSEAIIIPNSFKSALIPYWMGIKKRTGWLGEFRYGVLNNTAKLNKNALGLMLERLLGLYYINSKFLDNDFKKLDVKKYYPSLKVSSNSVANFIKKFNLELNKPILILSPGAAYGPAKKWPEEYYAEVARKKLAIGWQVWLMGSIKDRNTCDKVNQYLDNTCINLSGELILPETVAAVSIADVVVSNDSGLLHVAAALDKPLIGIYGSTSPDFTPPLIDEDKKAIIKINELSCSPCFKPTCQYGHYKCLTDIKPSIVINAINRFDK